MVPLLSPYGEGRYTGIERVLGDTVFVPLVFFSQSTVFSKRGYG